MLSIRMLGEVLNLCPGISSTSCMQQASRRKTGLWIYVADPAIGPFQQQDLARRAGAMGRGLRIAPAACSRPARHRRGCRASEAESVELSANIHIISGLKACPQIWFSLFLAC